MPTIARETKLDILMADLKASSNILSAAGEYWVEAKRSREVLDELAEGLIRWLVERRWVRTQPHTATGTGAGTQTVAESSSGALPSHGLQGSASDPVLLESLGQSTSRNSLGLELGETLPGGFGTGLSGVDFFTSFDVDSSWADVVAFSDSWNSDDFMSGLYV